MTRNEFHKNIVSFLTARTAIDPASIASDRNLVADRVIDSLLVIELFFHVESLIGDPIPTEGFRLDRFDTITKIYDNYVMPRLPLREEAEAAP